MSTVLLVLFIMTVVPVQSRTTTSHPQSLQTNTASPNQQSINSSFSIKENLISNQNRDKIFTECADNDWVVNPDEGNSFNTFTTTGAVQCWLYCEYILECHALSFDIMESTCILFNDSMSFLDNSRFEKGVSIGLYKRCMERTVRTTIGASLPDIVSLSHAGIGFLIEQATYQQICLTKGKSLKTQPGEDDVRYRLIWRLCTEGKTLTH